VDVNTRRKDLLRDGCGYPGCVLRPLVRRNSANSAELDGTLRLTILFDRESTALAIRDGHHKRAPT
jgi:hypothetical protein